MTYLKFVTCLSLGFTVYFPFPLPNVFGHGLYDVFPGIVESS